MFTTLMNLFASSSRRVSNEIARPRALPKIMDTVFHRRPPNFSLASPRVSPFDLAMNPFQDGRVKAVYVIHVAKFTDRAAHVKAELGKFDIPFEFILAHDADVLDQAVLDRYLAPGGPLLPRDLSVILKHMDAFRRVATNRYPLALVLEDDVVLSERFNEELSAIVDEARGFDHPFTIQIGCANNMYVPEHLLQPGRRLYPANEVRAADAYLINAEAARRRLEWMENNRFDRTGPHIYNTIDPQLGIRIYWSSPTIVEQGSMNGLFRSTLPSKRENKPLWFWKWKFAFKRLRKKQLTRFFK